MRAIALSVVTSLAAVAVLVASLQMSGAQTETPAPSVACAKPNVAASTLRAVTPDMPAIAQQQGISGTVQVIVSLDAQSHVTSARILSSPSAVLNAAALSAARQSVFQTEVRDCRPIAADYVFSISFGFGGSPYRAGVANSGEPMITVTTQGIAHRAADFAVVTAGIFVRDDDPANAALRNAAIFEALRTRLQALGIGEDKVRATYTLSSVPRPGVPATAPPYAAGTPAYGPYASRQITISVEPAAKAGAVVDAAAAAGVTSITGVRYDVRDRDGAYREALANGLKDAQARAEVIASTTHMRLGPIQNVQNAGTPAMYTYTAVASFVPGTVVRTLTASPVEVRADVTVTYLLLKP